MDLNEFHPKLKEEIAKGKNDPKKTTLDAYSVYMKLNKMKKPQSSVDGDIPRSILKEFTPEFATPVMEIFNKITESCEFPEGWKIEHQIVIQKEPNPSSEDQLRNLPKLHF